MSHEPACATFCRDLCDCRGTPPISPAIAARRKLDERAPEELRRAGLALHAAELDRKIRWKAASRAKLRARAA